MAPTVGYTVTQRPSGHGQEVCDHFGMNTLGPTTGTIFRFSSEVPKFKHFETKNWFLYVINQKLSWFHLYFTRELNHRAQCMIVSSMSVTFLCCFWQLNVVEVSTFFTIAWLSKIQIGQTPSKATVKEPNLKTLSFDRPWSQWGLISFHFCHRKKKHRKKLQRSLKVG